MRIKKTAPAVGVVGKVLNVPNNSTEDTYSCDYLNDSLEDIYSTDEVLTNKVWIDGKPIYRKVYTGTSEATSPTDLFTLDSTINVINIYGTLDASWRSGLTWINLDVNPQQYRQVYIHNNKVGIIQNLQEAVPYTIIVEYTKTDSSASV